MKLRFPGRVWKDGRFWLIEVPSLDITTQGRTRREALAMIGDAIEALVDARGFKVEVHAGVDERFEIAADANHLLALLLRRRRELHKYSLADVAKILGQRSKTAVARYEQGKSIPTWSKLLRFLSRLEPGQDILLDLRPSHCPR
jgi:predicted RNase H-like HicB family nuclease